MEPSVLRDSEVISRYGVLPKTALLYNIGTAIGSGLLVMLLASRIRPTFKILKMWVYLAGGASTLLPFFKINTGKADLAIHLTLAGILFSSIVVGIIGTSMMVRSRLNTALSLSMAGGGVILLLSGRLTSFQIIDIRLIGQLIISATFGIWLQANIRRKKPSLTT